MESHVTISDICRSALFDDELMSRYEFPAEWLNTDEMNVFEFILPYNTSGGDTNFRNYSVSVMSVFVHLTVHYDKADKCTRYDAIRLEVDL
jgi:hypothetical protein